MANGLLTITAEPTPNGPAGYASARLRTKFGFKYGRIEARINVPKGQGIWPAFWMLPMTGGWPLAGEIDIMETVGHEPNTLHGTVHMGSPSGHFYKGGSTTVAGLSDGFFVYGVTWTPGKISWDLDGEVYFTLTEGNVAPAFWPFDTRHFHILLNVAVGGNWPGNPDGTTIFPQVMQVDWVRVYKTDTAPASTPPVMGCMDPTAANFNALAEVEDGTCEFHVTLAVDMSNTSVNPDCGVHVFGSFNNWQVWSNPMQDTNGDGVWSTQITAGADAAVEFKFANCGDWGIESLPSGAPARRRRVNTPIAC